MLFINNKYTKWYYSIIQSASTRLLSGYKERHHIIPKCLGGNNDQTNLVNLTAREHFICHLLLTKMVPESVALAKLRFAFAKFRQSNKSQQRKPITSWEAEYMRASQAKAWSAIKKGVPLGPMPEATKRKLSEKLKGRPSPLKGRVGATLGYRLSAETRRKMSDSRRGKKMTLSDEERKRRSDHLKGIRVDRTGAILSDETKQKISRARLGQEPYNKGVAAPKFECPHCKKLIGGHSNFSRWHGNNCRARVES